MDSNIKILIADENHASRASIKDGLLSAGYKYIEEATNGEEAIMKIGRTHPDVVIIDVWLSKLDGIGVLKSSANLDFGHDKFPSFIV